MTKQLYRLFTTSGALVSYATYNCQKEPRKRLEDAKRARSIAALAGNIYSLYSGVNPSPLVAESTDDVIAHQQDILFETIMEFENGKLLISEIAETNVGSLSSSNSSLLLGIVGTKEAMEGMMQLKSERLKEFLSAELSDIEHNATESDVSVRE